jgi:hypothetical protein
MSSACVEVEERLLIPALGINWVTAIPALCCAFVFLPMTLANRAQLEAQTEHHEG